MKAGKLKYIDVDDLRNAEQTLIEKNHQFNYLYNHFLPELPDWFNKEYVYKDLHNEVYYVNLYNYSCTCDEFKEKEGLYKPGDVRRICRHIYNKLKRTKAVDYIDSLSFLILKDFLFNKNIILYKFVVKDVPIFVSESESEWMNVYVKGSNVPDYFHYSYNLQQKRWAYKLKPSNSSLVEILLQRNFIK